MLLARYADYLKARLLVQSLLCTPKFRTQTDQQICVDRLERPFFVTFSDNHECEIGVKPMTHRFFSGTPPSYAHSPHTRGEPALCSYTLRLPCRPSRRIRPVSDPNRYVEPDIDGWPFHVVSVPTPP